MSPKAQILRYWRSVEIFNPQSVPDVDLKPQKRTKQTDQFMPRAKDAPWQPGYMSLRPAPTGQVWRHEVYGGIYEVQRIRELLEAKFEKDESSFDERIDTLSASFQLSVDHQGRPLFDTFVLSACVWAWGRTISPGPDAAGWLEGFDEFSEETLLEIRQLFAIPDDDQEGLELLAENIALDAS